MSGLVLDVTLASELKRSLDYSGWTEDLLRKAMSGNFLGKVRLALSGRAHIVEESPIISLDTPPLTPLGWRITDHRDGGHLRWDPSHLLLHPLEGETDWRSAMETLRLSFCLNASMLDFFLANPWLIPDDFGDKHIFFPGTRYQTEDDEEAIRYMVRTGCGWTSRPCRFESDDPPFGYAALMYTGC